MPTQRPDKARKGSFLYNLLRPEFVRQHRVPLCCDAYSYFGLGDGAAPLGDIKLHNREVGRISARGSVADSRAARRSTRRPTTC